MAVVTGYSAIETLHVTEFTSNVQLLSQRMGKLRGTVMNGSHTGKSAVPVEQLGARTAQAKTTRHGDSPLNPQSYDRRWVYPTTYEDGDMIDKRDSLKMLADPKAPLVTSIAMALARAADDEIITALGGTSKTGETGSTNVSLTNTIANGSTALTVDKLRQAVRMLEEGDVDFEMEDVTFLLSPKGKEQLLATTEITSSDYNLVKALYDGQIRRFLGMNFIVHTGLPSASSVTTCYAYARSGVHFGLWDDIMTQVAARPDKSFDWYAYGEMTCGATRLEEAKVVSIGLDETK